MSDNIISRMQTLASQLPGRPAAERQPLVMSLVSAALLAWASSQSSDQTVVSADDLLSSLDQIRQKVRQSGDKVRSDEAIALLSASLGLWAKTIQAGSDCPCSDSDSDPIGQLSVHSKRLDQLVEDFDELNATVEKLIDVETANSQELSTCRADLESLPDVIADVNNLKNADLESSAAQDELGRRINAVSASLDKRISDIISHIDSAQSELTAKITSECEMFNQDSLVMAIEKLFNDSEASASPHRGGCELAPDKLAALREGIDKLKQTQPPQPIVDKADVVGKLAEGLAVSLNSHSVKVENVLDLLRVRLMRLHEVEDEELLRAIPELFYSAYDLSRQSNNRKMAEYLENWLNKYCVGLGFSLIKPAERQSVDSSRHQTVKTVPTNQDSIRGLIAGCLEPGMLLDGEILVRAAKVAIYT